MKLQDKSEDESISVTVGDYDSQLIEKLKEIIDRTSHKLPNTRL